MSAIIIENDALDALLHLTAHILEVTVDRASRFIAEVFNRKAFSYVKLHRLTSDALIEAGDRADIRVVTTEASDVLEAFRLYTPATPLCTDCRKPAVFLDPSDGVYKEASVHTPCPYCGEVLRPSTVKTHVTLWWSGREEAIGTRHSEGAEPLPETDQKIRDYLGRHGRTVHQFIEMALERELAKVEEPLCRFLNALFLCPDLRTFKNGHNRLGIIAALADSAFVAQVGEGNVKLIGIKARERWWNDEVPQPDAPVALSSRRGSIPPFRAKPPLGKMERMPPDPPRVFQPSPSAAWSAPSHDSGTATVVLLHSSSENDVLAARELRMYLLPLFKAHGIALWDRDHTDFPNNELQQKIQNAALIICIGSTYFFNEMLRDNELIEKAISLMNLWRMQQKPEKIFLIRAQHYDSITDGFFRDIVAVPHRPLSVTRNSDSEWLKIVEQIRERLWLKVVDARLEPDMIDERLRQAAAKKMHYLYEYQYEGILTRLGLDSDPALRSGDAVKRARRLVDLTVERGSFCDLRRAIELETAGGGHGV